MDQVSAHQWLSPAFHSNPHRISDKELTDKDFPGFAFIVNVLSKWGIVPARFSFHDQFSGAAIQHIII